MKKMIIIAKNVLIAVVLTTCLNLHATESTLIELDNDNPWDQESEDVLIRNPHHKQQHAIQRAKMRTYAHHKALQQPASNEQGRVKQKVSLRERAADTICNTLAACMEQKNIKEINKDRFDFILQIALNIDTANARTPDIKRKNLEQAIDECISDFFNNRPVSIKNIPLTLKNEFLNLRKACINKILDTMRFRGTTTIPYDDCQSVIHKSFEAFIESAEHVMLWDWANSELKNLDKSDAKHMQSSSVKPNKASKPLRDRIKYRIEENKRNK